MMVFLTSPNSNSWKGPIFILGLIMLVMIQELWSSLSLYPFFMSDMFTCCHTETERRDMTSVSFSHILMTVAQPVKSERL